MRSDSSGRSCASSALLSSIPAGWSCWSIHFFRPILRTCSTSPGRGPNVSRSRACWICLFLSSFVWNSLACCRASSSFEGERREKAGAAARESASEATTIDWGFLRMAASSYINAVAEKKFTAGGKEFENTRIREFKNPEGGDYAPETQVCAQRAPTVLPNDTRRVGESREAGRG